LTDQAFVFRSGWPNHWITVVRLGKIQNLSLMSSPFDRFWQMSGIWVDTAGARSSGQRLFVRYLDQSQAQALHQRMATQVSQARSIW